VNAWPSESSVVNPKFVEKTAAGPSTTFAAECAANFAQDDSSFVVRTSATGH